MQVNYRERIDTMKKSRIAGFIFDGSSLQAEITKTTDIMTTFYMALGNRSEAYDLPLADILSQLNDAGLQKIQEEVSNQLLHFGCS